MNQRRIDCHAHVIDHRRFPFDDGPGYKPRPDEDGPVELYRAVLEGNGVIAGTFTSSGSGVIRFGDLHATGNVTLQGATLEVNGTLSAANLTLQQSSTLTQSRATATTFNRMNVNLTGTLTIDATSAIDVSARGLTGSVNGTAYTYDRDRHPHPHRRRVQLHRRQPRRSGRILDRGRTARIRLYVRSQ